MGPPSNFMQHVERKTPLTPENGDISQFYSIFLNKVPHELEEGHISVLKYTT